MTFLIGAFLTEAENRVNQCDFSVFGVIADGSTIGNAGVPGQAGNAASFPSAAVRWRRGHDNAAPAWHAASVRSLYQLPVRAVDIGRDVISVVFAAVRRRAQCTTDKVGVLL